MTEPAKTNLFDDEEEQEYNPAASSSEQQQEPTTQDSNTNNNYEQPTEQNPYTQQQEQAQNSNNLFADAEKEDEYQPQAQTEEQNQQYPMGFGAERANLMQEEPVSMPEQNTYEQQQDYSGNAPNQIHTGSDQVAQEGFALDNQVDIDLAERANNAKQNLISEINQFSAESDTNEQAGVMQEEAPESNEFHVKDPVANDKVVRYTVSGVDKSGSWSVLRRYSEFESLRHYLVKRWPGVFIPFLPEKGTFNVKIDKLEVTSSKDSQFVEERRLLLEWFIRQISKFDFLVESKEFQIFAHTQGECIQQLEALPKCTPAEILEKYRLNFSHVHEDKTGAEQTVIKSTNAQFVAYLKRAIPQIESQCSVIQKQTDDWDEVCKYYQRIYYNMLKFEEQCTDYHSDGDRTKRLLTHPSAGEMPTKIIDNINQWKNSFRQMWVWIRGEQLDSRGMLDAFNSYEEVQRTIIKCQEKKQERQTELDKMTLGKTTLKSFFKSKNTIEKDIVRYQAEIEGIDRDTEDYKKLVNFIAINLAEAQILKFKQIKERQYKRMLNKMSRIEISNAHLVGTLSNQILELNDIAGH